MFRVNQIVAGGQIQSQLMTMLKLRRSGTRVQKPALEAAHPRGDLQFLRLLGSTPS